VLQHFATAAHIGWLIQQFALNGFIPVANGHANDPLRAIFAAGIVAAVHTYFRTDGIPLTPESVQAVILADQRDPAGEKTIMHNFSGNSR